MSRASLDVSPADQDAYSQFAIVATADNTTVHIPPSPTADLEGHTNSYTLTNLQQGATYQIHSTNYTGDVTGSWITSDKPVAVLGGANIAYVPDEYTGSGNPLMQAQLPVDLRGTRALALSSAGRQNGDSFSVLAAYSNKVVTITTTNAVTVVINQPGQFYDIVVDGPVEFQANQPIRVAQFANGTDSDGQMGDPCAMLLQSTGHYLQTNIVFALPDDRVTGDFCKQSGFNSIHQGGASPHRSAFDPHTAGATAGARCACQPALSIPPLWRPLPAKH